MNKRRVKIDGEEAGYAEVIPPGEGVKGGRSSRGRAAGAGNTAGGAGAQQQDPMMALISHIMDNLFRLPGTNVRFGVDPLIGLVPGVGDGAGALVSLFLIGMSARHGVPKIVLTRMGLNVILNTVGGLLPFGGDLFSVFFKSNAKNYALFQQHAGARRASTKGDWLFVGGLCAVVAGIVFSILFTFFFFLRWVFGSFW